MSLGGPYYPLIHIALINGGPLKHPPIADTFKILTWRNCILIYKSIAIIIYFSDKIKMIICNAIDVGLADPKGSIPCPFPFMVDRWD